MSSSHQIPEVPIVQLGLALSIFFVATYGLCIALGVFWPDWELHQPWLQFFPGFEWLTLRRFLIGLAESIVYAWYVAIVLGGSFNLLRSRR